MDKPSVTVVFKNIPNEWQEEIASTVFLYFSSIGIYITIKAEDLQNGTLGAHQLLEDSDHIVSIDISLLGNKKMFIGVLERELLHLHGSMNIKHCYECGKRTPYLFDDSRCKDCTKLTPGEMRGETDE